MIYSFFQSELQTHFSDYLAVFAFFAFPTAFIWFTWFLRWQNSAAAWFIKITGWVLSIAWMAFMGVFMVNIRVPLAGYWNFFAVGFSAMGFVFEVWNFVFNRLHQNRGLV